MSITQAEYAQRRKNLMAVMAPNSVAIVPAAQEQTRSRDTEFPFRQDSDLLYLCGFDEPEALLVLLPGREDGEYILFCRARDPAREIWDGHRAGPEGACEFYGADEAFPVTEINDLLPRFMEGRERVYYAMGRRPEFDRQVMGWVNSIRSKARSGAHPPGEFVDLDQLLHNQRLFKSSAELELMARSAEIAGDAHCRAMRRCQPGLYEYQLEAEILHEFAYKGARFPAYTSIVGGGANACVLHYISNGDLLKSGDLVLIDAGCEYQGYASDVTRTFPVSGVFSPEQKALYEVVLAAQAAALAEVRPGNPWNAPHDASVRVITQGLLELGLLQGVLEELIDAGAYKTFYMHRVGHWLGMDVHDVGDYKEQGQWRVLAAGMVMTVEPGIYVAPDNQAVEARWRGIGIRIEDDVAVTADGHQVLSSKAPKTVADIEALMAEQGAHT